MWTHHHPAVIKQVNVFGAIKLRQPACDSHPWRLVSATQLAYTVRSIFCADIVSVPAQLHYLHVKCSRRAVSGLTQQNKTAGDCSRFKPSVVAHPPLYARSPLFCFSICSFIIKCLGISEGYDSARIASCAPFFFFSPPLIGFLLLCQGGTRSP